MIFKWSITYQSTTCQAFSWWMPNIKAETGGCGVKLLPQPELGARAPYRTGACVHCLRKASVLGIFKLTVALFNIADWTRGFCAQALGLQKYSNKACQFCALLHWTKLATGNDTSWFWLLLLLSLFMNPQLLFNAILIVFYLVPHLWGSEQNLNQIRHFWLSL